MCDGDSSLRTSLAAAQIAGRGFMTIEDERPDSTCKRTQTLVSPSTLIVLMQKFSEIIDVHPRSHTANAARTWKLTSEPITPAADRPLLHQPVETADTHPEHEQYRPGNTSCCNARPLAPIPHGGNGCAQPVALVGILEKTPENSYFSLVIAFSQNSSDSSSSSSHTR